MDLKNLVDRIGIESDYKSDKGLRSYSKLVTANKQNLETLVSEFSNIMAEEFDDGGKIYYEMAPAYYEHIYKNISGDYNLSDIEIFAKGTDAYEEIEDVNKNSNLGLFISAAINKVIKPGERVYIDSDISIDYLLYGFKGAEAYVRRAGNLLGLGAEKSKVYADEAGFAAGESIKASEFNIGKAGTFLGNGAENSSIYAKEAGDCPGFDMTNSKLFIYKLIGNLPVGCFLGNNKIYLGEESYKQHADYYKKGVLIWEK